MALLEDDFYDDGRNSFEELLAQGEYESRKENILAGFKVFQKKYVYKSIALQMILVILGIASQLMTVVTAAEGEDVSFSIMLIILCIILGIYIIMRPKNIYKKLEKSLGELDGTIYKSEIYTNKIIITTLYDPYISEEAEKAAEEEKIEENNEASEEDELPPATVIHLDNAAVEIVDCSDMFVVYIKKVNVFVIPKSAFKPYDVTAVKDKLSNIMGVRYKDN